MDEVSWPFYASALLTGLAFGYVTQRGGFCLTRALSNLYLMGDATIVRAYLLALLVATVGVHLLLEWGLVDLSREQLRQFHWASNLLGGFLFGIGMILSGGCSGSTWYRTGEGAVGAWVVLVGFAMGATTTTVGILAPVNRALKSAGATSPTLPSAIGSLLGTPNLSPWWVIIPLGILVAWALSRGAGEPQHGKWSWPATGAAVGVMITLGWWTSTFGGAPTGITFAVNTGHALTYPLVGYPNRVTWSMVLLVGVPVGAFLSAWPAREFRWKLPPGWSLVQLFAGGLLMGASAILAEGCNITQGLTNGATLAVGSLVAFGGMWLGAYAAVWVMFLRRG